MFFGTALLVVMIAMASTCNAMEELHPIPKCECEMRLKLSPRNSPTPTVPMPPHIMHMMQQLFSLSSDEKFQSYSIQNDDIYATSIDHAKNERILRIIRCQRIKCE